jgi:hypothetical protein
MLVINGLAKILQVRYAVLVAELHRSAAVSYSPEPSCRGALLDLPRAASKSALKDLEVRRLRQLPAGGNAERREEN